MNLQKENTSRPEYQIEEHSEFNDQILLNKKDDEEVREKNESGEEEEVREEIIIVKEEWCEDCDSNSSLTQESTMPESSTLESSQLPLESNILSGPSYESDLGAAEEEEDDEEKEGGEEDDEMKDYQEDPLANNDSNQIFVCTHCDFKTCLRLDFETHIRQHVQLLFTDKVDSDVATLQNTSCSKNIDTVEGRSNIFKRVIEAGTDFGKQQLKYKCTGSDKRKETASKNIDTVGGNRTRDSKREIEHSPEEQVDYKCLPPKKKRVRKREPRQEQLFTCGYCDFKCLKTDMMKDHLKIVHAGKPAAEKSVPKKSKPEKEPLVCELCGFKCIKMAVMKVHNRSHTGERPFSCSHCDQTFVQNSHLTKHLKRHAGKITLQCKSCEFVCKDPVALKQHHQQVHRLVKTLQCCHLCEHKFLTASQLQRHLRTHSGERPFSCTVCDYRSAQMDTLKAHFRTHTGEKPYSCAQCAFKCAQLSALKTHQLTHTNEKPFSCDRCDYRCARASNLRRHMERHVK